MIVYTSKTCAPCSSLKKFLDHKGVEYRLLDIDEDPVHAHTVLKLTGTLTVPVTVIEGHPPITGLNYSGIAKALKAEGLI
jgi:glutaredoxin